MKRLLATTGLLLAFWATGTAASAGVYTDELSKCLVRSASPADQSALIVWMFSAMSVHPDIAVYSKMTPAERNGVSRNAARIMQRLMTVDCHAETVSALKYEGVSAIESSFSVLGGVAMRGLMGNPKVDQAMSDLSAYEDPEAFRKLAKEAGITLPAGNP